MYQAIFIIYISKSFGIYVFKCKVGDLKIKIQIHIKEIFKIVISVLH